MAKFTIVNETLQIQVGSTNVLVVPQLYVGVNALSLYENEPKVSLFNLAQGTNLTIFEGKLSDCTDSAGITFTLSTFLVFASTYFGTITGSGLTDAQLRASPVPISPRPNTTGSNGTTAYKLIALATTNANVVKNTGGNLYSIVAIGLTSTVRYLKLYNKATAPNVGTDIPVMTIPIPANTQGAGIAIPFSMGVNFPLGIALAITSGLADNDNVAILANDVVINLTFA